MLLEHSHGYSCTCIFYGFFDTAVESRVVVMDHKAHKDPDQPRMPCVDRRALEERLWQTCPFIDSQGTGGGNAPDT